MTPSPPTAVSIRPGRPEDAPRLAALMVEGLQTRFSHLGNGVVRLLHQHMIASRHCLCLVAERGGRVAGYAAVILSGRKFYREFLIRRGVLCGLLALPRLISPSNLRTVWAALTYFPAAGSDDPEAELVSLVVGKESRGSGVGRDLWDGLVLALQSRGIPKLKITTDVRNEAANRMYSNRGCRLVRTQPLYHDSQLNVYVYDSRSGQTC